MPNTPKNLPLAQANDPVARVLKEKIGDILSLGDAPKQPTATSTASADQKPLEETVINVLKKIYDPEIPISIYELGLIYRLTIDPTNAVKVEMTLTAPGCPVAGEIVAEVKRRIEAIPEVPKAEIELVWDPPWTKDRLSEEARLELGMM